MHLRAAVLGTTLLLSGSAVCFGQPAEGSFERTLKVSGELTLEVATGSGRIEVHTGSSDTVVIRGRVRASDSWFATNMQTKVSARIVVASPPSSVTPVRASIKR